MSKHIAIINKKVVTFRDFVQCEEASFAQYKEGHLSMPCSSEWYNIGCL